MFKTYHGMNVTSIDGQHDTVEQMSCTTVTPGTTVKSHFAQLDTSRSKGIEQSIEDLEGMHTQ